AIATFLPTMVLHSAATGLVGHTVVGIVSVAAIVCRSFSNECADRLRSQRQAPGPNRKSERVRTSCRGEDGRGVARCPLRRPAAFAVVVEITSKVTTAARTARESVPGRIATSHER